MKRVISILLASILLLSHVNLIIGTHFCGGEAVMSRLIFAETHLNCGMANMDEPSNDSGNRALIFTNTPCCENHYQTIQATDDYIKEVPQANVNIDVAGTLVYSVLNEKLFSKSAHQFYSDYSPPPLEKDMRVLFQTFLI